MVNKNYRKGRDKEYKLVNQHKREGFVSFRSAGSHSPIDVVAINPDRRVIFLIQAKPDSMSQKARDRLEEEWKSLNGTFEVTFKVV